ncbi:MAG: hypothetical protein OEZ39_14530 [Gammaproteobacteria bacterium]|nr:hypothetical protein [Gammaproteobacteria bacterium]
MSNDLFLLQLGHPKISSIDVIRYGRVCDVFNDIFFKIEESIYLYIKNVPVRIRYFEDLYHNFDEILAMTWMIQKHEEGETKISLRNQIVVMEWEISWKDEEVSISIDCLAKESLYEKYAVVLNAKNKLIMSSKAFLSEWKTLLHQVLLAFEAANVEIEDGTERRKLELLQRVEAGIDGYGKLYTRPI